MSFAAPAATQATPSSGGLTAADLLKTPVSVWLSGVIGSPAPVSAPAPAAAYRLDLVALQHGAQGLVVPHSG
jgi:hypothetical protein